MNKSQSKKREITMDQANKSADEWLGPNSCSIVYPMRSWMVNAFVDPKQHRDIGKILANCAEIHVIKKLSEKCGRPIIPVVGEPYDAITNDDKPPIRIQIKFRMDAWHFETTRRNSKKNNDTNSTGHVAYKNDEFDIVAIFKPGHTFGISDSTIRLIPVSALINPSKPDQLITNINSSIRKVYDNEEKTEELVQQLFQPSTPI